MKQGLYLENNELIYYEDGEPKHAGAVKVDGDIYYISSKGRAVQGEHIVHDSMSNGILKRGTYTFGEDYKLVKGSYRAPRKKRRKNSGGKLLEFMKRCIRNKKTVSIVSIVMIFCLAIAMLAYSNNHESVIIPHKSGVTGNLGSEDRMVVLPSFEEDVLLCSGLAKELYDGSCTVAKAATSGNPYKPFVFEYSFEQNDGILRLGERQDLSDANEYTMPASGSAVTIDNLKTDTDYYYQVVIDGQEYMGTFHTAKSTRFVYIPGVYNTRDIGGYETLDGNAVNQGLLIRGTELDGLVEPLYFLPEESLESVQDTFDFVYDMDLREYAVYQGDYTSRLGKSVGHAFYQAPQYGQIFNANYKKSLRQIFADLADENKYPMYLHCTYGADRTGTIVYLLQGILNMSEEDMMCEYQMTGFVDKSFTDSQKMNAVAAGLQHYAGDTLQEKIVTFLTTDIGVTMAEIKAIREIYLQ